MEVALLAALIVVTFVGRAIVLRLWRAGRLSDRTAALLMLGRFPVVCFLFGLILRVQLPLLIGLTILALLPSALFYRHFLDLLREQAEYARRWP